MSDRPPNSSLNQHVVLGLRWSVIRQIILTVVGTAAILIYTRQLGPEGMGTYAIAGIIYSGLLLLIQSPFRDAVIYFRNEAHTRAIFNSLIGFGLTAGAALFFLAPQLGDFYEAPASVPLIRGMILVFLVRALAVVPASQLLQRFRFDLHEGFLVISETVFTLVIILTLLVFPLGVLSLVAAHLAAGLVFCLLVWRQTEFRPSLQTGRGIYRAVMGYAGSLLGSQALKYANLNVDQALVGRLGEKPLGLYSFGENQSGFLVVGIGVPMSQIAISTLSPLRDQKQAFKTLFLELMRLTGFVSTPYHLIILTLAPLFVALFFGPDWLPAVPILRAYLVFRVVQTLLEICDAALSASGRPEFRLRFDLLLFPLFAAGAWFSVTYWGNAAATAYTLAGIRLLVGVVYLAFTLFLTGTTVKDVRRYLVPAAVAAVAVSLSLFILEQLPFWDTFAPAVANPTGRLALQFVFLALGGTAVYLLLAYLFDRQGFVAMLRVAAHTFLSPAARQKINGRLTRWRDGR